MFKKLASFLSGGSSSREHKLIVVGLDNSGKSTILGHLKPGGATTKVETVPTVGFSQEEFSKGNITFTAFDMSGQGRYRNLWEHYYKECQGIIFCIDSTDKIRLCARPPARTNARSPTRAAHPPRPPARQLARPDRVRPWWPLVGAASWQRTS